MFHHHGPSLQAEVKASSGDQEYSADFESTTTTSVVSVPSAPSTPRDTPPLGRGMRGDTPPLDGGVRAEVEVPEEEGVADDPAAVTPVVTPRPTSEEEEVGRVNLWGWGGEHVGVGGGVNMCGWGWGEHVGMGWGEHVGMGG